MKNTINLLGTFAFNALFGLILALTVTDSPEVVTSVTLAFVALGLVPRNIPDGSLMAGVNKEIWTSVIMEHFYPDGSWLNETVDMTEWVDFNTINLADAGLDPEVLVNNTSYPVPTMPRPDTPLTIELETYDTKNTVVRNVEAIEAAYPKMESVTRGHRNQLQLTAQKRGAYNIAPAGNTANTPVILTTGEDDGTGRKRLKGNDLLRLASAFDLQDFGPDRIWLAHAKHIEDLMLDKDLGDVLKAQVISLKTFGVAEMYGFKCYKWSKQPAYVRATLVKKAYGAAVTSADTDIVSVVYLKNEVMRADGTIDMFLREKDPEARGDIIGFQKRFKCMPIRAVGQGAIVSAAA